MTTTDLRWASGRSAADDWVDGADLTSRVAALNRRMNQSPQPSIQHRRIQEARRLAGDLLGFRPAIYWADLLTSLAVAWGATCACLAASPGSATSLGCGIVASLAILRVTAFRQEIGRLRRGEMTAFTLAWNLLAGIPLLMPAFRAAPPLDARTGDTPRTPAFAPLRHMVKHLSLPCLSVAVLGTTLVVGSLGTAGFVGMSHAIPTLLVLALAVVGLDRARALVAGRLRAAARATASGDDPIDAVNIDGSPLVALLFPLGMRYEALHRLLPALPYHNLGAAHRRILEALPDWQAYRDATHPSPPAVGTPPREIRPAADRGTRRAG